VASSDNCPGQTVTQLTGLPSGATFPKGTTTNAFKVTDASGNTARCAFNREENIFIRQAPAMSAVEVPKDCLALVVGGPQLDSSTVVLV
jgi:hypothetical protein